MASESPSDADLEPFVAAWSSFSQRLGSSSNLIYRSSDAVMYRKPVSRSSLAKIQDVFNPDADDDDDDDPHSDPTSPRPAQSLPASPFHVSKKGDDADFAEDDDDSTLDEDCEHSPSSGTTSPSRRKSGKSSKSWLRGRRSIFSRRRRRGGSPRIARALTSSIVTSTTSTPLRRASDAVVNAGLDSRRQEMVSQLKRKKKSISVTSIGDGAGVQSPRSLEASQRSSLLASLGAATQHRPSLGSGGGGGLYATSMSIPMFRRPGDDSIAEDDGDRAHRLPPNQDHDASAEERLRARATEEVHTRELLKMRLQVESMRLAGLGLSSSDAVATSEDERDAAQASGSGSPVTEGAPSSLYHTSPATMPIYEPSGSAPSVGAGVLSRTSRTESVPTGGSAPSSEPPAQTRTHRRRGSRRSHRHSRGSDSMSRSPNAGSDYLHGPDTTSSDHSSSSTPRSVVRKGSNTRRRHNRHIAGLLADLPVILGLVPARSTPQTPTRSGAGGAVSAEASVDSYEGGGVSLLADMHGSGSGATSPAHAKGLSPLHSPSFARRLHHRRRNSSSNGSSPHLGPASSLVSAGTSEESLDATAEDDSSCLSGRRGTDVDALRTLLVKDSSMQLVDALYQVAEDDQVNNLSDNLVVLFEAHHKTIKLIRWALRSEVESTANAFSLFREDSIASKLMSCYARIVASSFLAELIQPTLRKLKLASHTLNLGSSDTTKRLLRFTSSFVSNVTRSLDVCPFQLRVLCHYIRDQVERRFPQHWLQAVGAFLFLRLIVPALVQPDQYDLLIGRVKDVPPQLRRLLIAVGKNIQSLVNAVVADGSATPQDPLLRTWIHEHAPKVKTFLAELPTKRLPDSTLTDLFPIVTLEEGSALANIVEFVEAKAHQVVQCVTMEEA